MHAVANSAAAIMAGSVIATGAAAVSVSLRVGRSEGGWLRVGLESAGEGRGRVVRAFERLRALMDLAMIARRAGFALQEAAEVASWSGAPRYRDVSRLAKLRPAFRAELGVDATAEVAFAGWAPPVCERKNHGGGDEHEKRRPEYHWRQPVSAQVDVRAHQERHQHDDHERDRQNDLPPPAGGELLLELRVLLLRVGHGRLISRPSS